MKRGLLWIAILTLTLIIILWSRQSATAETDALMDKPVWQDPPPPGVLISVSQPQYKAGLPTIRYSADGSQLVIVYDKQVSDNDGDSDPYYVLSTNNGATWSAPQAIYSSPALTSKEVSVAFRGNIAHATWIERSSTNVETLVTAAQPWPATIPGILSQSNFGIFQPYIINAGNDLHVVWSEGLPPAIRHKWSANGGQTWSAATGPAPVFSSFEPKVAVGQNGVTLHVVWKAQESNTSRRIFYAQGTRSGNTYTWSTPIQISAIGDNASHPNIVVQNGRVEVVYSRRGATRNQQDMWRTICLSQCTIAANWSIPANISGQLVGTNDNSPFDIVSDMAYAPSIRTTFVYFHGTQPAINDNEVIWGVNSCDGWSASTRDQVTEFTYQSLKPSIAIDRTSIQLVYEYKVGNNTQIYHRRGTVVCPAKVFMPIMRK